MLDEQSNSNTYLEDTEATTHIILNLLTSSREEFQAQGAENVRDLARKHLKFVLKNKFAWMVSALLQANQLSTRTIAASVMVVLSTSQDGREQIQESGTIKLLSDVLKEGIHSSAAEHAALALMNCSVDPFCKDDLLVSGAIPHFLELIRQSTLPPKPPLKPAAVSAAGALINLVTTSACRQEILMSNGTKILLDAVAPADDSILVHRCRLVLQLLETTLEQFEGNMQPDAADEPGELIPSGTMKLDSKRMQSQFASRLPSTKAPSTPPGALTPAGALTPVPPGSAWASVSMRRTKSKSSMRRRDSTSKTPKSPSSPPAEGLLGTGEEEEVEA